MKVKFTGKKSGRLYFRDLDVNESFRNATSLSQGAVYTKVECDKTATQYMLEVATGKLYPPTHSQVERVEVEANVHSYDPGLYD